MKAQINTVLFDMDGTLIDTELSASQVIAKSFQEWKIPISGEDISFVTGRTWEITFQHLFNKYPIPIPESDAKELLLKRYQESLEMELIVVPGSVQAVQALAGEMTLGLVSGSKRAHILWALKKLKIDHHFKVILGSEDYPRSKPEPDGYLKAVEILKAKQSSCLVFEDSTAGIQSARSAGLWVTAITSTNHFKQDQSQAHHQIQDLRGVTAQWIKSLPLENNCPT